MQITKQKTRVVFQLRNAPRYPHGYLLPPARGASGEFDEEILADLLAHGFSGGELLEKFREMRRKIRPAVERLVESANLASCGKGEFSTYEEIFGNV